MKYLQSAMEGNQMIFLFVAACLCDILILFIFCLSGEIIIHSNDISNDVYQLNWYRFDKKSKYFVFQLIIRAQKPYYFASWKTINCSLETFALVSYHCICFSIEWEKIIETNLIFKQIIRKAGAVLAMLQSI